MFTKVHDVVERSFRHVADAKHLEFDIEMDPQLPRGLNTDLKRLQQVLKNRLSNAFKFTSQGRVDFRMAVAGAGWSPDQPVLNSASRVIAFEVRDTGVGIPPENKGLFSRHSTRATQARADATAAPASGSRSAVNWRRY